MLPGFICFFFSGMWLADLYAGGHQLKLNNHIGIIAGICILIGLPFVISVHSPWFFFLKLFLMNAAFYLVLFNNGLKNIMSRQLVTIIGGMCYSIYLLHLLIMAAVAQGLAAMHADPGWGTGVLYTFVLLSAVLVVSVIFYRLIEQPCMRKDWYKKLFRKR